MFVRLSEQILTSAVKIAVHYEQQRIYWLDNKKSSIEVSKSQQNILLIEDGCVFAEINDREGNYCKTDFQNKN